MKHRKHLIEAKIVSEHVVWFLFADRTPSFQGNQWTPTQPAIFAVLNCVVNRGEYKPVQRPLNLSVPNNVFQHESRRLDYCKGLAPKRIWGYFMPLWFREISHGYCCSCWWIISCTSWRSIYPRCFKCEPSRMVAWFFVHQQWLFSSPESITWFISTRWSPWYTPVVDPHPVLRQKNMCVVGKMARPQSQLFNDVYFDGRYCALNSLWIVLWSVWRVGLPDLTSRMGEQCPPLWLGNTFAENHSRKLGEKRYLIHVEKR